MPAHSSEDNYLDFIKNNLKTLRDRRMEKQIWMAEYTYTIRGRG